jgi:hypothetical protein
VSTTLQRSPLTDAVLTQLRTLGPPVGDAVIPDSMWIGQPNLPGSFADPFAVLSTLRAGDSSGSLGDSQSDWHMPYLIESFGVSRDQCDWIADRLRNLLTALRGQALALGPDHFKVQYVRVDDLGEPARIDAVDPPFYHSQDVITVWIGKERS